MSDMKPKGNKLTLGDKEYGTLFNLNAIDAIQDEYDIPISGLTELMRDERKSFKVIKFIIALLVNEWIDDTESEEKHITPEFVGRKISIANIGDLKTSIFKSFSDGMPVSDDDELDEESPNAESEQ